MSVVPVGKIRAMGRLGKMSFRDALQLATVMNRSACAFDDARRLLATFSALCSKIADCGFKRGAEFEFLGALRTCEVRVLSMLRSLHRIQREPMVAMWAGNRPGRHRSRHPGKFSKTHKSIGRKANQ